jgi:hypothetical protein
MTTISAAIRRLIEWLAEQEPSPEEALSPAEWADLPIYHPVSGKH